MESYKQKIVAFFNRNKRMPGYKELMTMTGFKSKNAVYKLINRLVEANILEKDSAGRITLTKASNEIPYLGLVEAGFPTTVEEELNDTMSIDEYLVENKDKTFILEVKGDSMIDAGIREGDFVIAEKTESPREGEIVIAEVDSKWTMKYLRKDGTKIYLEAANKNYRPIFPKESLRIAAVVKGVVRKY